MRRHALRSRCGGGSRAAGGGRRRLLRRLALPRECAKVQGPGGAHRCRTLLQQRTVLHRIQRGGERLALPAAVDDSQAGSSSHTGGACTAAGRACMVMGPFKPRGCCSRLQAAVHVPAAPCPPQPHTAHLRTWARSCCASAIMAARGSAPVSHQQAEGGAATPSVSTPRRTASAPYTTALMLSGSGGAPLPAPCRRGPSRAGAGCRPAPGAGSVALRPTPTPPGAAAPAAPPSREA